MGRTDLSNKVSLLLLVLGEGDGILEDVIGAIVGLAGLELGDNGVLVLLLGKVLVEGEGVVLLLGLSVPAGTTLRLGLCVGGFGGNRGGPGVGGGFGTCPVGGGGLAAPLCASCLGGGIYDSSLLGLELGVAVIASPGLVELLVRIAGEVLGWGREGKAETHVLPV